MIKNVILDFGHGGIDKEGNYTTAPKKMHTFDDGTIAYEGVLNRQIGKCIADCLKDYDHINVIYTVAPSDPTDVTLSERVRITNNLDPKSTIFVSIHCNASPNHNAGGFEVFTTIGITDSDTLAANVRASAKFALDKVGMKDRGMKEQNFKVLRETHCPAIMVECGFFDFRKDFDKLSDPLFQGDLGSFIATGILNYIHGKNK